MSVYNAQYKLIDKPYERYAQQATQASRVPDVQLQEQLGIHGE